MEMPLPSGFSYLAGSPNRTVITTAIHGACVTIVGDPVRARAAAIHIAAETAADERSEAIRQAEERVPNWRIEYVEDRAGSGWRATQRDGDSRYERANLEDLVQVALILSGERRP